MSWLRDNWLDALIFLLFALVVGGIVLFLTGVNPLRKSTTNDTATPPAVTAPADPAAATDTPLLTTPDPEAVTPEPEPESVTPEPEPTPTITVSPQIPAPAASRPTAPAPSRPSTPAPTPSSNSGSSGTGSWQVAVGAFSQAQNAQTLAQTLRKQGYEVSLSSTGSLTRVTVGPFPNEQRARSVATALGEYGAQALRVASTPAASAPTPAPSSPAVTVASPGNVLLQVGAFRSQAGAQATLKQLQQAGYSTVLVDDGSLYKIRVSVSSEARDQAKAALSQQGFQPIEVKP
jgi:cell division septation protein DedD